MSTIKTVELSHSGLRGLQQQLTDYTLESISFGENEKSIVLRFEENTKVIIETTGDLDIKFSF